MLPRRSLIFLNMHVICVGHATFMTFNESQHIFSSSNILDYLKKESFDAVACGGGGGGISYKGMDYSKGRVLNCGLLVVSRGV